MGAGMSALQGNTDGLFKNLFGVAKGAWDENRAHEVTMETKTSPADVIQWAGCKDSQTVGDGPGMGRWCLAGGWGLMSVECGHGRSWESDWSYVVCEYMAYKGIE